VRPVEDGRDVRELAFDAGMKSDPFTALAKDLSELLRDGLLGIVNVDEPTDLGCDGA